MLMQKKPHDHIPDIIEWLETQPSETEYNFQDTDGDCLIGRYGRARNKDWHQVHTDLFWRDELWIASNNYSRDGQNYGAALERARKCIKERV